jgi:general secretion pathway protein A
LVEVGWDGDLEPEVTRAEDTPSDSQGPASLESDLEEQLVDDRYAAMQAWTEWSRNRERSAPPADAIEGASSPEANPDAPIREERTAGPDPSTPGKIRPGAPHEFAPYSQLFSRLRQSKQG